MKIYLASSWVRQSEMRGYCIGLTGLGHEVTSGWLYEDGDGLTAATLGPDPAAGTPHAARDLADIRRADAVMVFTGVPSTSGGMHVELGYALGLDKRVIVVGPRENIFQTLPQVEWHPDWDALMAEWLVTA